MRQTITTHLWFDKEAKEAAHLYTSTFTDSKIISQSVLQDTPSGAVDIVVADLCGTEFTLLSAGPYFKFNPSVSFLVSCAARDEVNAIWKKLSDGGSILMELGSYPFSEWYGWVSDRFGVSWQIMLTGENRAKQKITPFLMFVGSVCGKAEEAIGFYTSTFRESKIQSIQKYGKDQLPDKEGAVFQALFELEHKEFRAMDSAHEHKFAFNEAVSFIVHCDTQEDIDYYWNRLSAVPESEQCGWLKDKYGLSWQIVPTVMEAMMASGDTQKISKVTEAFLKMKKFDIAKLQSAYDGK